MDLWVSNSDIQGRICIVIICLDRSGLIIMLEILTNVGFNPTANDHNCVCVRLKPCSLDGGMLMGGGGSIPSVCLDNVHLCLGDTGDSTY